MGRTVSIGAQDFATIREEDCFLVDKTSFIAEWWRSLDIVTLITRPRRFGKTLNMSMLECFFSVKYANRGEELFGGLKVWDESDMRALQGQYPVIFLSFAGVKETTAEEAIRACCAQISIAYSRWMDLLSLSDIPESDKARIKSGMDTITTSDAALSLNRLSDILYRAYNRKPIILLDEYDTPHAGGIRERILG